MGTAVFYTLGTAMMVGSVILLFAKKRRQIRE